MKETGQIKPEDKENFMNQESQTPHKRRVRYKGKYPKKFEEKYKELQPEKYKDTIEHVISKGNTPAGMHISIMVKEIIDFLEIRPGQVGFDATLGYGGHTTCQRVFQALRIDVNREFEVLYDFMEKLPGALKPGGRVAILTFHSGEDKLVKKALKQGYKDGIYSEYSKDVIRPSAQECAQNGRARSTKMRWAVKA